MAVWGFIQWKLVQCWWNGWETSCRFSAWCVLRPQSNNNNNNNNNNNSNNKSLLLKLIIIIIIYYEVLQFLGYLPVHILRNYCYSPSISVFPGFIFQSSFSHCPSYTLCLDLHLFLHPVGIHSYIFWYSCVNFFICPNHLSCVVLIVSPVTPLFPICLLLLYL